jgi:hypothetical protein
LLIDAQLFDHRGQCCGHNPQHSFGHHLRPYRPQQRWRLLAELLTELARLLAELLTELARLLTILARLLTELARLLAELLTELARLLAELLTVLARLLAVHARLLAVLARLLGLWSPKRADGHDMNPPWEIRRPVRPFP